MVSNSQYGPGAIAFEIAQVFPRLKELPALPPVLAAS